MKTSEIEKLVEKEFDPDYPIWEKSYNELGLSGFDYTDYMKRWAEKFKEEGDKEKETKTLMGLYNQNSYYSGKTKLEVLSFIKRMISLEPSIVDLIHEEKLVECDKFGDRIYKTAKENEKKWILETYSRIVETNKPKLTKKDVKIWYENEMVCNREDVLSIVCTNYSKNKDIKNCNVREDKLESMMPFVKSYFPKNEIKFFEELYQEIPQPYSIIPLVSGLSLGGLMVVGLFNGVTQASLNWFGVAFGSATGICMIDWLKK